MRFQTPRDPELWQRVAEMYREQGKLKPAIYCLQKAYKATRRSDRRRKFELMLERCDLYEEIGFHGRALHGFTFLNGAGPVRASLSLSLFLSLAPFPFLWQGHLRK